MSQETYSQIFDQLKNEDPVMARVMQNPEALKILLDPTVMQTYQHLYTDSFDSDPKVVHVAWSGRYNPETNEHLGLNTATEYSNRHPKVMLMSVFEKSRSHEDNKKNTAIVSLNEVENDPTMTRAAKNLTCTVLSAIYFSNANEHIGIAAQEARIESVCRATEEGLIFNSKRIHTIDTIYQKDTGEITETTHKNKMDAYHNLRDENATSAIRKYENALNIDPQNEQSKKLIESARNNLAKELANAINSKKETYPFAKRSSDEPTRYLYDTKTSPQFESKDIEIVNTRISMMQAAVERNAEKDVYHDKETGIVKSALRDAVTKHENFNSNVMTEQDEMMYTLNIMVEKISERNPSHSRNLEDHLVPYIAEQAKAVGIEHDIEARPAAISRQNSFDRTASVAG